MASKEPTAYILDTLDYQRLQAVKTRLYDDRPLNGDQRRDLANTMDAVLHGVTPVIDNN